MKKKLVLAVSLAVGLGSVPAMAADSGFYLGAGFGQATASGHDDNAVAVSEFFGSVVTSVSSDDTDTSISVFGGYDFNKHVGLEVNYADLGARNVTVTDNIATFTTDQYKFGMTGFGISLLGKLPITEKFSMFGKLGLFTWESTVDTTIDFGGGSFVSTSVEETGSDLMLGIGATYRFTCSSRDPI